MRFVVRWLGRKLRGVAAFALAVVWLAGPMAAPARAQAAFPPPAGAADFPRCVQAQVTALAATAPGVQDRNFFHDPDTLLGAVWVCAGYYADRQLVPIGKVLLGALVVIMVVWAGVGFMFSGELNLGSLLGTLFLAGFGFALLDNYFGRSAVLPWLPPHGFVEVFPAQALRWGELIKGDTDQQFQFAFRQATVSAAETYYRGAGRVAGDPERVYADAEGSGQPAEAAGGFLRRLALEGRIRLMASMRPALSFVLWLVNWMIYAQYVWGYFTLIVLTVLGPVFIPFMMVAQLDFLFWGWFKAMINGFVYMLTASAMYAGVAMLLVAPLQRIAEAPLPGDPGSILGVLDLFMRLYVEYVPMVVMSLFAALKVNAVSGMIVAGGTPPGSGLASGLTKAESGLRTAAGWAAGPGRPAPVAPLSQTTAAGPTPKQAAAGAYADARRRVGRTAGPAGGRGRS